MFSGPMSYRLRGVKLRVDPQVTTNRFAHFTTKRFRNLRTRVASTLSRGSRLSPSATSTHGVLAPAGVGPFRGLSYTQERNHTDHELTPSRQGSTRLRDATPLAQLEARAWAPREPPCRA